MSRVVDRLEKVINEGVDLRHQMRAKTETKSQIIACQRETILNQSEMINELEKEVKELRLAVTEKQQNRARLLEEKKQDKMMKLSRYNHEVLTLNALIRKMKDYIKARNGGVMPDDFETKPKFEPAKGPKIPLIKKCCGCCK